MILSSNNILSQYLSMRQNFYDKLTVIGQSNTNWFKSLKNTANATEENLTDYVYCTMDLSLLKPKLYIQKDISPSITDECIKAFRTSFILELNEKTDSALTWSR